MERICIECDARWSGEISCPEQDCKGVGEPLESARSTCPNCKSSQMRFDVCTGETDCVDCGWTDA